MGGPTPIVARVMPPMAQPSPGRMPVLLTATGMALDESHYCVICSGASTSVKLALPASNPANAGRIYVIKNVDVNTLTVNPDAVAGDNVEDKASLAVKKNSAVTLIADGAGAWRVIALAA
jgi:hypothetical protein